MDLPAAPPPRGAPGDAGSRPAPPGRRGGLARLGLAAAVDLVRLVLPVACAGCGLPDVPWCAPCAAHLLGPPRRCDHHAARLDLLEGRTLLPVLAPASFAGPVRHAVTAWKDGGRADLDRPFAAALRRTARRAPVVATAVLVVAVPSSPAARRRRGRAPVDVLAAAVAAGLRDVGVDARRASVLARTAGPDLAGLGARARGAALAGRVRVRRPSGVPGRDVVLVDDVLTTGATLAACRAALVAAGARVVGAYALAATPPPSRGTVGASAAPVASHVHDDGPSG
jgi:predicted amidophosphoribosyltransferase